MIELLFLTGMSVGLVVGQTGVTLEAADGFGAGLAAQDPFDAVGGDTPIAPAAPVEGPTFAAEESTGQFTTADEVRPILTQTKDQWISLRDFDGQDLLYFTQLDSWRCGLAEVRVSVNGGPLETREMEPCHLEAATPNEIRGDVLPYTTHGSGEVRNVAVMIVYDDGTSDVGVYDRAQIMQ
ncbi:MAG: hypothetical protein ACU0BS_03515 [Hasllibacter sp.]